MGTSLSRRLLRSAGHALGLGVGLLVLAAVAVLVVLPRVTGAQAMTVLSGSMTPGIPVGSVVLVRPVDPATLAVGDVATYQAEPGKAVYVTHRIVAIADEGGVRRFTFKGDANRGADVLPVQAAQVRGKLWFHAPYLGHVRDRLHSNGVRVLLAVLLLGGYAVAQLVSGLRERGRDTGSAPTGEAQHVEA